nr:MAG: hypothetical protein [Bacteriophage sp.]
MTSWVYSDKAPAAAPLTVAGTLPTTEAIFLPASATLIPLEAKAPTPRVTFSRRPSKAPTVTPYVNAPALEEFVLYASRPTVEPYTIEPTAVPVAAIATGPPGEAKRELPVTAATFGTWSVAALKALPIHEVGMSRP